MTSSETYYYATDPTGSVSGLAEFTGAASVTHRYRYDVWGKPQGNVTEAVPNPLRFKARQWDDDTGLADFRARWYDPDIGRFISEDPIGLAGGINVYRFVGNDPVSGWDPFGLFDPDCPDGVYEGATCEPDPLTVEVPQFDAPNPGGGVYFEGSFGGFAGGAGPYGGGGGSAWSRRETATETAACVALSAEEQRIVNRNIRRMRTAHSYTPWTASAVWYYNVHPADRPFKVMGLGTIGFVRGHGKWDYKNHGGTHAFGNIHYGATGSAAGIPPSTLLWGSNQAQRQIQTGESDDAQDRRLVMQGVQYFQNGCWR